MLMKLRSVRSHYGIR